MDESLKDIAAGVAEKFGEDVDCFDAYDELTVAVQPMSLVELMRYLRDDPACQFHCLIDICGVDWPAREKRFDVVYHLLSPRQNLRIRVKVATDE
ncbi:MAG: NADH-quinone oxidoreductase subunit C, partial [Flavobacteriaceae bacterium]